MPRGKDWEVMPGAMAQPPEPRHKKEQMERQRRQDNRARSEGVRQQMV